MSKISAHFFEKYRRQCEICNHGKPVVIPAPDPQNSSGTVRIMFILERPGPVGPKQTGFVSFDNPDPTARFLKELFGLTFGLSFRKHIFITNACIWIPQQSGYRNTAPTAKEILCGLPVLQDQIIRIRPRLLVPVGGKALFAFKKLYATPYLRHYQLQAHIGKLITDATIPLYPVYHTSGRGQLHRTRAQQHADWQRMKRFCESIT